MDKISVPVIIPAYEPDERMINLIESLRGNSIVPIVIVNDGSGSEYASLFDRARSLIADSGVVLEHDHNRGKGAALKTAFRYVLDNYPNAAGVVTADSDGQHSPECISLVRNALVENKDSLVIGARKFNTGDIPWKSRFGNSITAFITKRIMGLNVSDTQTGLRGIPYSLLDEMLKIEGDRFEYEMRMLFECRDLCGFVEVPIKTIYDSKDDHSTHFDPFRDSVKIYKVIGEYLFKRRKR